MQVIASLIGLLCRPASVAKSKWSDELFVDANMPRGCVCKLHWSDWAADKQQKKQAWLIRDQCLGTLLSHSRGDTAEAAQDVSAEEHHLEEGHPCVWMGTG